MGLKLKLTTDKWLTTDSLSLVPPKRLLLAVMLQRDWGRFESEPAIQERKSGIVFPLKKAVKNRVQYHGERCNRGQFIALWNTTF